MQDQGNALRSFEKPDDYTAEMDSVADTLTDALNGYTANESLYKTVVESVLRLQRMADHWEAANRS